MRRRRAFTMAELLISMVIIGMIMGSILSLFFSVFENYDYHQDITEAKQTGMIAMASIQPYIVNAGLGLPVKVDDFKDSSFRWGTAAAARLSTLFPGTSASTKNFHYFIQPALNAVDRQPNVSDPSPALWVVYALPSGIRIIEGDENFIGVMSDTSEPISSAKFKQTLKFSGTFDSQQLTLSPGTANPMTIKHWVTFPAATPPHPFTVTDVSTVTSPPTMTLRSHSGSSSNTIVPHDELHYVRAAKIFVQSEELKIDRLDGSGAQPVVNNIVGMWCTFDPEGDRVLTVRILARAGIKRTAGVQSGIDGWPAEAEALWGHDNHYRHAVVSRSWRIRN